MSAIFLIAPPVWTPIYPYLALPALTGYLRQAGLSVIPYDASLDFFLHYLLDPRELGFSPGRLDDPESDMPLEDALGDVETTLSDFQDPSRFFEPEQIIRGQQRIRHFLRLASRTYGLGGIAFNGVSCGPIRSIEEMMALCDSRANPFLGFCRERVTPLLGRHDPHLIGISLSTPHQLIPALTMSRFLKREFPEAFVVLGGKQCQSLHEKFVRHPVLFQEFFHGLVQGQGERPAQELTDALTGAKGLKHVSGLSYLEGGRVRVNPPAPPLPIQDLPPPDFDGLPLASYLVPRPYLPIRFSEGCYWGRCSFCSRFYEGHFAVLPPERAVDQLALMVDRHGATDFALNDDCLPPPYLEAFCRELLRRRLQVSMQFFGKPVKDFTRSRLELLAQAGVKEIRWGIESANRRILRLMNKGTDPDVVSRILEDAHGLGIWNHACMILGFPSETREEAEETVSWMVRHKEVIHSYYLFEFHLDHGSHIFRHPEAYSIRALVGEDGPFSTLASFSTTAGMSREEVRVLIGGARRQLLEDVYGHPFWYYLRDREYLQLYLSRFGLAKVAGLAVNPENFSIHQRANPPIPPLPKGGKGGFL
jgi:hypothetical protein